MTFLRRLARFLLLISKTVESCVFEAGSRRKRYLQTFTITAGISKNTEVHLLGLCSMLKTECLEQLIFNVTEFISWGPWES